MGEVLSLVGLCVGVSLVLYVRSLRARVDRLLAFLDAQDIARQGRWAEESTARFAHRNALTIGLRDCTDHLGALRALAVMVSASAADDEDDDHTRIIDPARLTEAGAMKTPAPTGTVQLPKDRRHPARPLPPVVAPPRRPNPSEPPPASTTKPSPRP